MPTQQTAHRPKSKSFINFPQRSLYSPLRFVVFNPSVAIFHLELSPKRDRAETSVPISHITRRVGHFARERLIDAANDYDRLFRTRPLDNYLRIIYCDSSGSTVSTPRCPKRSTFPRRSRYPCWREFRSRYMLTRAAWNINVALCAATKFCVRDAYWNPAWLFILRSREIST